MTCCPYRRRISKLFDAGWGKKSVPRKAGLLSSWMTKTEIEEDANRPLGTTRNKLGPCWERERSTLPLIVQRAVSTLKARTGSDLLQPFSCQHARPGYVTAGRSLLDELRLQIISLRPCPFRSSSPSPSATALLHLASVLLHFPTLLHQERNMLDTDVSAAASAANHEDITVIYTEWRELRGMEPLANRGGARAAYRCHPSSRELLFTGYSLIWTFPQRFQSVQSARGQPSRAF